MQINMNEIRRRLIDLRSTLSAEEIKEKSLKMTEDILNSDVYKNNKYLYIYSPIKNEIDTNYLIVKALQQEKVVSLPVILSSGDMLFCQINNSTDFRVDRFKIIEPILDPKKIVDQPGLMIVPLVGFSGNKRMGYGKQYYNNYLASRTKYIYTIGVAYKFQEDNTITFTEKDIALNEIRAY